MKNPKHGGNVWELERKSHKRFDRFLDFSSNINPLGPPRSVKEALARSFKKVSCYPDPEYIYLRQEMAGFLGIDYTSIFAGNGLSQIIDLIARSNNFKQALVVNPAYSEYELSLRRYKIPVTSFNLIEKDNFNLDEKRFYEFLKKKREAAVFLCNPNNPTGTLINPPFFEVLLKKMSSQRQWLIIDEAFIDFTPCGRKNSLTAFIGRYPRLIVLWSLTKIFSIPGLRLGAALANNKIIERLQAYTEPWSVNIMAQEAAVASLRDKIFLEKTGDWIKKERAYLYNNLRKLRGLKVYASQANFFLVKILKKSISARDLNNRLIKHGMLIRDCSNFHSLDRYYFRVAVKERPANKRLVSAFKKYLG